MAVLGGHSRALSGQWVLQGGCVVLGPQGRGSCVPQGGIWHPQLLSSSILYNKAPACPRMGHGTHSSCLVSSCTINTQALQMGIYKL